ncbi:lysine transporter LysE [Lacinutrix sp. WUR7]|uniref:LysE family transporter n=1 Tax=Lacinutrix TaxID=291183 RepID=UPI0006E2CB01|nr:MULTISPECIES: LysE family transporter [Lacinutrix]QRM88351.1 lysine transporter LysE [Lacinutrix sp. WUR7]
MTITITFFLGLLVALVGVTPPGLLNMTAAKISLKDGYSRGITFSIGACVIIIIQTYIGVLFARYLSSHQDVVDVLQRVAFILFVLITIYFLLIAKTEDKPKAELKVKSKKSRFFQGMLLSALNVFPIPYQAYMSITLASFGWMSFEKTSIFSYVAGAATGSFVIFYIYIFFFDKIKSKTLTTQKSMNYLIGAVTGIISIITLFHIIKDL